MLNSHDRPYGTLIPRIAKSVKRLLFNDLLNWCKSSDRMPLLLRGARQVGKTHLIRQLGKQFEYFAEINFEKKPELAKIFDYDLDPRRIIREIFLALNIKIEGGKTLLFLDEVQEAPKVIIALRYFYEELPELHVIAAGSLVDFAIEQVGVPVGRISFLYMYPMSFIEYLAAKGYTNLAIEIVNHKPNELINEAIHNQILRVLGEYMAIGGMPKAVHQWINNQDIRACESVLKNIKNAYQQDFEKYAKKHQIKYLDLLFKKIPSLVCQHFNYTNLETAFRKRELEPSLYLLEKAGIVYQIIHSHGNGIPLGAETDFSKFKLIMLDVGLTQAILGLELKDWFIEPANSFINKGNLSEGFVGQELLAYSDPSDKQNLYYWHRQSRASNAEVDYLITHNQKIISVEVKSGHGAGLQSMRLFLQSHPNSPYGIRFSIYNYSITDNIQSYPLYAVAGVVNHKERLLEFLNNEP